MHKSNRKNNTTVLQSTQLQFTHNPLTTILMLSRVKFTGRSANDTGISFKHGRWFDTSIVQFIVYRVYQLIFNYG